MQLDIIYMFLIINKEFSFAQPIELPFSFSEIVPEVTVFSYALIWTNEVVSISSDEQRQ